MPPAILHSREDIERAAKVLMCVPTDNRDALCELGFEPANPQITTGYESAIWIRTVDHGWRADLSERRLVVQRAFLHTSKRK